MSLAPESLKILIPVALVTGFVSFLSPVVLAPGLFLLLFTAFFFRSPKRICPQAPNTLYSPADGKVITVESTQIEGQDYWHLQIFLSVFNCHINRMPIAGEVVSSTFVPGKFKMAFDKGIETENQRQESWLNTSIGKIKLVQITGFIARRIACRLSPGMKLAIGQKFGLIYFGSRTDLYLPKSCTMKVQKGQALKAGLTAIASY